MQSIFHGTRSEVNQVVLTLILTCMSNIRIITGGGVSRHRVEKVFLLL